MPQITAYAALLCLTLASLRAGEETSTSAFTAAEFRKHATYLASNELSGRLPGSEGSAMAAKYVIEHFKAAGLQALQPDGSWLQDFPLPAGVTGRNVLAVRHGKGTLKDQAVLVTGHYDHIGIAGSNRLQGDDRIFNGADDNAAGVSIMLMIARRLSTLNVRPPENCRTVVFSSFDAEEKGLLGARHYARNPVWPLKRTSVVINFDGGGRLRLNKVFASDAETNPLLSATVRAAATKQGLVAETRFGGHGRSDHAVFADLGIPGVHFVTGAHSDYHQVTDEVDRLNFEGGAKIAGIGYDTLLTMMTHQAPIRFHKLKPEFDVNFGINLAKIIGLIPMINAQEGRYPQILYVFPNSPAAKLGVQSGDQITALDDMKFQRVEDFISIFPRIDFSDGVKLSILRSGDKTEILVPAEVISRFSGPTSTVMPNGRFKVRFIYEPTAADVSTVYLAGEFNNWNPAGQAMDGPSKDGEFTTVLTLPKGFHEYKFVEEGTKWITRGGAKFGQLKRSTCARK